MWQRVIKAHDYGRLGTGGHLGNLLRHKTGVNKIFSFLVKQPHQPIEFRLMNCMGDNFRHHASQIRFRHEWGIQ